jgi:hypothetical protein
MFFCPTSQVESNSYDCDTKGLVLYEQSTNMEPSVYCHKVNIVKICACNRILGQHSFFCKAKLLRQPLIARNRMVHLKRSVWVFSSCRIEKSIHE